MGKARQSKTFARKDYAATEEDFEEAMAAAMAASQQDAPAAPDRDAVPTPVKKDEREPERRTAAPAGGRRSRSRSRRRSPVAARAGRQGDSRGPQQRRGRGGSSRSRSPHRNESRRSRDRSPQRPPRAGPQTPASSKAPAAKSAKEKAKEAAAKEKEKALMKKQQREKEQQEKLALKEKEKELRKQELNSDIANAADLAVVSAAPTADDSNSRVAALATSETEQASVAATAAADAAAADAAAAAAAIAKAAAILTPAKSASTVSLPPAAKASKATLDEVEVKKLFQLLDRSEKNAVSKRDVLMALRKHAPVRVFFGLPAGSASSGSGDLETRITAIQDSFEASSGLGELSPAFEELSKAGDGGGQNFAWDSFLAYCQQDAVHTRAAEALALLPREHSVGASFKATYEWQVVPEGACCEAGLEYRLSMETGRRLGRLPRPKGM